MIVLAICVVVNRGISADKAIYYSLAFDTKENLKTEKDIGDSLFFSHNIAAK